MSENVDYSKLSETKQALLAKRLKGNRHLVEKNIINKNDSKIFVSSGQQQAIWLHNKLMNNNSLYNIPVAIKLTGNLDIKAIEKSFVEIIRRHEPLRTSISLKNREVSPLVNMKYTTWSLEVQELSDIPCEFRQREAYSIAQKIANAPFDLTQSPLFRVKLIKIEENDYLLVFVMHHIISDEWSVGVFLKELENLYKLNLGSLETSGVPYLKIDYTDYALWQDKKLIDGGFQNELSYWKQKLNDELPILQLPSDFTRPNKPTGEGNFITFKLPDNITTKIRELSNEHGLTLFIILVTIYYIFLNRYCEQEDIIVGVPVANRNNKETENLIGCFSNVIPIRITVSKQKSFIETLNLVKEEVLKAMSHSSVPFDKVIQQILPNRESSSGPVFQTMFVLQNTLNKTLDLPEIDVSFHNLHTGISKYDLTMAVEEIGKNISITLEYSTELFKSSTIERIKSYILTLVEGVLDKPDVSIKELSIISKLEKDKILLDWNQTDKEYMQPHLLHQLFEEQVKKTPHSLAIKFGNMSMTYRELNSYANNLALLLLKKGVGPDDIVGVFFERSLEMVVSLLAILKAGGAYLPLDPSYPNERLNYIVKDSGVRLVITQNELINNISDKNVEIININDITNQGNEVIRNIEVDLIPDNLAYVIYTSGSTGKPKGTMNTHKGICNRLLWMQDSYQLNEDDRVLQKTPYSFDVSVWEFFWPILSGAALIIAKPDGHKDSKYLKELIMNENITTLHFVPSMMRLFLDEPGVDQCKTIKHCICSGEELSQDLKEKFFRIFQANLYNLYGPTEAAIDVTSYTCEKNENLKRVPIGRPISNIKIYILNKELQPTPVRVPGELYIGGIGLARGYLNKPELTHEKFIENPFSDSGERLYKSGDLARFLEDGTIEYLGRIDFQIKLRGFRVELGEIESVLKEHNSVNESVVIVKTYSSGYQQLIAYIVSKSNNKPSNSELKKHLSATLPAYMVPSEYIYIDDLPLNTNGKLDRNKLPDPKQIITKTDLVNEPPKNQIERKLMEIWSEVLDVEYVSIGRKSGFFELGGNSLQVLQVIHRVEQSFGVSPGFLDYFELQTVSDIAHWIQENLNNSSNKNSTELKKNNKEYEVLSFSQEQIWLGEQMNPGTGMFNIQGAVSITGDLNLPAMLYCLNEIFTRHEILRTKYKIENRRLLQFISQNIELPIRKIDLSNAFIIPNQLEEQVNSLINEELKKPFNLANDLPVRMILIQKSANEYIFIITMHHICSDGWSINLFIKELTELYDSYMNGLAPNLPELKVQYSDYALWQRSRFEKQELNKQINYWKNQLGGQLPILNLQTKGNRGQKNFLGESISFKLSKQIVDSLKQTSNKTNTTVFMILLAAFKLLINYLGKEEDVIVGTPLANRSPKEVEHMQGCFINPLPARTDLGGNPKLEEILQRVRKVTLELYENQEVPFELIVNEINPERSISHSPIFQVMFTYHNTPTYQMMVNELQISPYMINGNYIKYDLLLDIVEAEYSYEGKLTYDTDLFSKPFIETILVLYKNIIEQFTSDLNQNKSEVFEMMNQNNKSIKTIERSNRQESMRNKLKQLKPKPVSLNSNNMISSEYLRGTEELVFMYKPEMDGVDLIDWAKNSREEIEKKWRESGAVLFRGFNLESLNDFKYFTKIFSDELESYKEPSTPRTQLEDNIYTSTEYPADQEILMHNENSYTQKWPLKIWFNCIIPALEGGETPIVDSAKIYQLLKPETRRKFEEKKVLYVRNYSKGLDLPWQKVFQTDDPLEVENYCHQMNMECEWLPNDRLRTSAIRPAVARHFETGEKLWFNQAHLFHFSSLPVKHQEILKKQLLEAEYPRNTYYGDGSPIEQEVLDEIREVYSKASIYFPWEKGDILMVDNMKVAHGRKPYTGSRKVVVAMSDIYTNY